MNINSLNSVQNFSEQKTIKTENTVKNLTCDKICPSKFCDKPEGCEQNLGVVTLKSEQPRGSDELAQGCETRLDVNLQPKQKIYAKTALANYSIPKLNMSFKGTVSPIETNNSEINNTKKVKIKDLDGNDVNAEISEKSSESGDLKEKKFELKVGDKMVGYALIRDDDYNRERLVLSQLYTQEHEHRTYKGAGTELLKCVVNESIKRGYNGKVNVGASHGAYSPLAFYYKNNFIIKKLENFGNRYFQNKNAAIQYAIENNIPINDMLFEFDCHKFMYLDEKGAKALLEGKRLYKERTCEKIDETNINGKNYSANLIQSPYENEYFLMIVADDKKKLKAQCFVNLLIKTNESGKKHFEIQDLDIYAGRNEQMDFALKAIEKTAEEKGFDKTTISSDLSDEAKSIYKDSEIKFETGN